MGNAKEKSCNIISNRFITLNAEGLREGPSKSTEFELAEAHLIPQLILNLKIFKMLLFSNNYQLISFVVIIA